MTIIVSVKINDGIVMAADSALSFANSHIYDHANKIVNLRKGLPVGVMSTGAGGIGNESLETLFKDLRKRLSGNDLTHQDWQLNPVAYSMSEVANRVREFLFVEKTQSGSIPVEMLIRLCGYSSGKPLAETWQIILKGATCDLPELTQDEASFGPRWNGDTEALDRLILGMSYGAVKAAVDLGATEPDAIATYNNVSSKLYVPLYMNAMPIQDAIDLARFLVDTTSGFVKFSLGRTRTVGGTTEIAAITKHEGFKWVQRKHFFKAELN